ncbi:hypothetical protein GCM10009801_62960 [Streptomyces albiaxialis]|uniref:GH16 domain-containing protein n=1 Tax=Streptomyces albiaxialis TaxID=329523 RepID=A0ABN2WNN8_9ACTN
MRTRSRTTVRVLLALALAAPLALTASGTASGTSAAENGPPAAGPTVAGPPGGGWTRVFGDEFDGTSIDTSKWDFRTDVKAYSAQRRENVSVRDGKLTVALKKENHAGKAYTGGGIVSKRKLRYGYYETRARINDGAGWHSSFWLMAGDGSTTFPKEQRTEIDGFETDSAAPAKLSHNIHSWRGSGEKGPFHHGSGTYDTGLDLRQWHTYGIDWSESGVRFSIDGKLRHTAAYTPDTWQHDYLNIWLTTIGYGTEPDAGKLPSAVQADYVRYWQRDLYADNDGPASYGYSATGTWRTSALTGWTRDSPVGYACAAGDRATWRPDVKAAGKYEAYIWKSRSATGGDPAARATLDADGAPVTRTLDEREGEAGWVSLGTRAFARGTGGAVTLTASGTGCAHADAVKLVRR